MGSGDTSTQSPARKETGPTARVAAVLMSTLVLFSKGPKLLNAKVQDLVSTFDHIAKTLLTLRSGTGTCARTKSIVEASFLSNDN